MTQAEAGSAWRAFDVELGERTGVATVTLTGTGAGNAMGGLVWSELPSVFEALDANPAVRAVVLRGSGDCFSVGMDLRWYIPRYRRTVASDDGTPKARQRLLDESTWMQNAVSAVAKSRCPVVAAVHGSCVGVALELIAACDIRMASADALFSLPEVRLGIVADLGVLQRLLRIVGAGHTRELALTGGDYSAVEARSMGLVTRVLGTADALFEEARSVAEQVAGYPPRTVFGIKRTLDRTQDMPIDLGMLETAVWNAAFLPSPEFTTLLKAALRDDR